MTTWDFLTTELTTLEREGLLIHPRTVESAQGAWITVDGKRVLNLCANNYLGLANHPKRLRERAHLDIDLAEQAKVMANAPTAQAQHALAVRVIDHDQRLVLSGHIDKLRQGRNLAIHAEDPVGNHQPPSYPLRALESCCEVVRITVTIPDHLRSRQSTAINDTGVVEFVRENGIALLHQGRNHREVGVEA